MKMPLIFAHRGASQLAPENTLAAFQRAHELGAKAIEFDVQLSHDNRAFIFHDDDLARTCNGNGLLSLQSAETLEKLDAGSWFGKAFVNECIPTLDKLLAWIKLTGIMANIELKPDATRTSLLVQEVLKALNRHQIDPSQILLSSFLPDIIQTLNREDGVFQRGFLLHEPHPDAFRFAKQMGCISIHPNINFLTTAWIKEAHRHELLVYSYTINDPTLAQKFLHEGLDGFFTDNAALYRLLD